MGVQRTVEETQCVYYIATYSTGAARKMRFWAGNEVRREKKCEFFFRRVKRRFGNLLAVGWVGLARKCGPYVMLGLFRWGIGREVGRRIALPPP